MSYDFDSITTSLSMHSLPGTKSSLYNYCRAGSEATNRAAMSFLYVYIYVIVTGRKWTLALGEL